MALDWTRHASRLGTTSQSSFAARFAAELADLAMAYPDRRPGSVLSGAFLMQRRHAEAVRQVVARAIGDHAQSVFDRTVPAQSLLSALLTSATEPAIEETSFGLDRPELEPDHLQPDPTSIFPLRVVLVSTGRRPRLKIIGLSEFNGAHLRLVERLRPYHEVDCMEGLVPARHRYIAAGELGDKNTVWQHAKRCRDEFAQEYKAIFGVSPGCDLLLHSTRQRGYRIDPEARFVADTDHSGAS